ncbi:expressed unknown protein [Seminavis robusta]|uniref:Uncharacterized protein n=1 Tax=Seminavis robusta TaxID=568900 RepID=A0A9N8E472_9STRA|nr:expressed unknown protein [Seminavis robusta]|eukprot:Sro602_g173690.1 n/a (392) ;mRNA; f:20811-22104
MTSGHYGFCATCFFTITGVHLMKKDGCHGQGCGKHGRYARHSFSPDASPEAMKERFCVFCKDDDMVQTKRRKPASVRWKIELHESILLKGFSKKKWEEICALARKVGIHEDAIRAVQDATKIQPHRVIIETWRDQNDGLLWKAVVYEVIPDSVDMGVVGANSDYNDADVYRTRKFRESLREYAKATIPTGKTASVLVEILLVNRVDLESNKDAFKDSGIMQDCGPAGVRRARDYLIVVSGFQSKSYCCPDHAKNGFFSVPSPDWTAWNVRLRTFGAVTTQKTLPERQPRPIGAKCHEAKRKEPMGTDDDIASMAEGGVPIQDHEVWDPELEEHLEACAVDLVDPMEMTESDDDISLTSFEEDFAFFVEEEIEQFLHDNPECTLLSVSPEIF